MASFAPIGAVGPRDPPAPKREWEKRVNGIGVIMLFQWSASRHLGTRAGSLLWLNTSGSLGLFGVVGDPKERLSLAD